MFPPLKSPKLKRGHAIRHTKSCDDALLRAKFLAESHVRHIPDDNPPFLLVVDERGGAAAPSKPTPTSPAAAKPTPPSPTTSPTA